jgi:hypothetical protein
LKVLGIDGREYSWNLKQSSHEDHNRSGLHLRARFLLKSIFPFDLIYEEIALPGTEIKGKNSVLFCDFYIPLRSLMVEVNGAQHSQYTPFFHGTKLEFARARTRDKIKKQWCELNGITLVEFEHNEKDEQWKTKI